MSPWAYPERPAHVALTETHASYLFFTGKHVYKVKKAVDYGFLDFTNLEKRRYFCEQEVLLNRRTSPHVYLGVVPINEQDGTIVVGGSGRPIEYAVKMLQLPAGRALDELLRRNQASKEELARVAAKIAGFHRRAPNGPRITRLGRLSRVRRNIEDNLRQVRRYVGLSLSEDQFDDLTAYSQAFLDAKANLFYMREAEGRIREGHGDLHAANVFLTAEVEIIDCIEFNQQLRCLDVAQDIAFLAMDLDFFDRKDLSEAFVAAYVQASGDKGVWEPLNLFKAYYACVRGKVYSLRLDDNKLAENERQLALTAARAYFHLAHTYTQVIPRPMLIMATGLMGTGKTYLSAELARRWHLVHISSDVTRKELAGILPTEHRYEAYERGMYSPEMTQKSYDAMFVRASRHLGAGRSVVLDASFRHAGERQRAVELARQRGAEVWIIECAASEEAVRTRLARRIDGGEETASDGRWELYFRQKDDWEQVEEVPEGQYIRLDTGDPASGSIQALLQMLYKKAFSSLHQCPASTVR